MEAIISDVGGVSFLQWKILTGQATEEEAASYFKLVGRMDRLRKKLMQGRAEVMKTMGVVKARALGELANVYNYETISFQRLNARALRELTEACDYESGIGSIRPELRRAVGLEETADQLRDIKRAIRMLKAVGLENIVESDYYEKAINLLKARVLHEEETRGDCTELIIAQLMDGIERGFLVPPYRAEPSTDAFEGYHLSKLQEVIIADDPLERHFRKLIEQQQSSTWANDMPLDPLFSIQKPETMVPKNHESANPMVLALNQVVGMEANKMFVSGSSEEAISAFPRSSSESKFARSAFESSSKPQHGKPFDPPCTGQAPEIEFVRIHKEIPGAANSAFPTPSSKHAESSSEAHDHSQSEIDIESRVPKNPFIEAAKNHAAVGMEANKMFVSIISQAAVGMMTSGSVDSSILKLFSIAAVTGFLGCLWAMHLQKNPKWAKWLSKIGAVASSCGIIFALTSNFASQRYLNAYLALSTMWCIITGVLITISESF